jgi:hypothetical protein
MTPLLASCVRKSLYYGRLPGKPPRTRLPKRPHGIASRRPWLSIGSAATTYPVFSRPYSRNGHLRPPLVLRLLTFKLSPIGYGKRPDAPSATRKSTGIGPKNCYIASTDARSLPATTQRSAELHERQQSRGKPRFRSFLVFYSSVISPSSYQPSGCPPSMGRRIAGIWVRGLRMPTRTLYTPGLSLSST